MNWRANLGTLHLCFRYLSICCRSQILGNVLLIQQFYFQEFNELSKTEQEDLLARNTPLYLNFILGNYLTSETGVDQVRWILGPNAFNLQTSHGRRELDKKKPDVLNKLLYIFEDDGQWKSFLESAGNIKQQNLR